MLSEVDPMELYEALDVQASLDMKFNTLIMNQRRILNNLDTVSKDLAAVRKEVEEIKERSTVEGLITPMNTSLESSCEELQNNKPYLTINYKGEEMPLYLPPSLEWSIAGCNTKRGTIRLLLKHLHDIKTLRSCTLTGTSLSPGSKIQTNITTLPEISHLYIQMAVRNKFPVEATDGTLQYEKAIEKQISNTRCMIGKVLQDIKSNYTEDGQRKPVKKRRNPHSATTVLNKESDTGNVSELS